MKFFLAFSAAMLVCVSAWSQKEPQREPNFWMKKKLEFSQHILSGLATADFEKIVKSASSMNNLSEIESVTRRTNSEAYRTQLRIFRYANEQLIKEADKKNIDGATLAFSQLTLSCVNCHKLLREPAE